MSVRYSSCFIAVLLVLTCCAGTLAEGWDPMSDTWDITDALGRKLPNYWQCGMPQAGSFVGIYYVNWHGPIGTKGPYDISKILAADPTNPKWGPAFSIEGNHYWGEPELGYYLSDDEYVIRKHCALLVNAGVDVVIFECTNGTTYTDNYMNVCRIFRKIRQEGGRTPQICFWVWTRERVVEPLYNEFYAKKLYLELWFKWMGKPLMLANPRTCPKEVQDFFTFRETVPWAIAETGFGTGEDKWTWVDGCPQKYGWHIAGVPEEVSVAAAQHPTTNMGRSNHNWQQPDQAHLRPAEGIFFADQWEEALKINPRFIFVTEWNEWTAVRLTSDGKTTFLGRTLPAGETYFMDQYNEEYSRDVEPMKGGHSDNYYYQMMGYIRRFKGVRPLENASAPKTIRIDGKFDDWKDVRPEFRDNIFDTTHRDHAGVGSVGRYVNNTGRNDFKILKVARDDRNLYFYAETTNKITSWKDPNWMLLFIDADCNRSTGWEGYDYLINSTVLDAHTGTVKKSLGGAKWATVGKCEFRVEGNKMELSVPRSLIKLGSSGDLKFLFHWADNIQKFGDIIEFATSGDSAPDRRANYRYSTSTRGDGYAAGN